MARTSKALAILRDREAAAAAKFDSVSRELCLVRDLIKTLESTVGPKKKGAAKEKDKDQPKLPGT